MSPQRGCRGPACSSPLKQVSIVSNTQRRGFTHNSDFANLGVLSPARAEENLYPNHLTLAPPHAVPSGPSGGLSGAQRWAGTGSEAWHSPGQPLHAAFVLGPEVWAPAYWEWGLVSLAPLWLQRPVLLLPAPRPVGHWFMFFSCSW